MKNGFFRGHGLGNDYVVMDPKELSFSLTPSRIKAICDRNWGLGSDGILALVPSKKADFGLRIFNPDGSEAEKSGNGLRIFARYLHATGKTKKKHFTVETKGGAGHDCTACGPAWGCERRHRRNGPGHVPSGGTSLHPHDQRTDRTAYRRRRPVADLYWGQRRQSSLCRLQTGRAVLVTGGSPEIGTGIREPCLVPEANERTTRRADRPQGTLHPDLGARGRRNPGLRVLFLRCCERGYPTRAGEKPCDGEDAGRAAQHPGRPGLQPHHEGAGCGSGEGHSQSIVCAWPTLSQLSDVSISLQRQFPDRVAPGCLGP